MERGSRRSWFTVVFGLIFVVCGLAAAYASAGKMIVGYIKSSNWVEVPAVIHDLNLVSNRGDTTTYSLKGRYSYTFNGANYNSDRISLSTSSDNIGEYWQALERTLHKRQQSNEASALVNPSDPTESVLDRTLRWKSVLFGSLFLVLFTGLGAFCTWMGFTGRKVSAAPVQQEQGVGISSDQKSGSWFLAAFGGVFFLVGVAMSLLVLPEAIRKEEYGALFILLFVLLGAGILYYAIKLGLAYRRFGPTPLILDPYAPGVGGQLGGQFSINVPNLGHKTGAATQLRARLVCVRKRKSKDSTSYDVKWQEEVPVFLEHTASGVDASFFFDIPANCAPSKGWQKRSSIVWSVTVEGEFDRSKLGHFERTWKVVVGDRPAVASRALSIPTSFLENDLQHTERGYEAAALDLVPVTEDAHNIYVYSKTGGMGNLLGILFGLVFASVGIFTMTQGWWLGILFVLIGTVAGLLSLHALGKSIEVHIDKTSRVLFTRERWFGLTYANRQAALLEADQFSIKKTSSTSSSHKKTEYFVVNFKSEGKKIRIADGVEGKEVALALKEAIVSRCFH